MKHRLKLHARLRKAESSLAVQMRTGKIGLAAFLHARKVPRVLMFCPEKDGRREMLKAADTNDYKKLLSTNAGLRASAK